MPGRYACANSLRGAAFDRPQDAEAVRQIHLELLARVPRVGVGNGGLWDGQVPGWEVQAALSRWLWISLPCALGDLAHAQLGSLRDALGVATVNSCSAFQARIVVGAADAARQASALWAAGFAAVLVEYCEVHLHELAGLPGFIDEDEGKLVAVAAKMMRAGVPLRFHDESSQRAGSLLVEYPLPQPPLRD